MSRKKTPEAQDEPPDDDFVGDIYQEKPPGAFDVQVEDYVADAPTADASLDNAVGTNGLSDKPGPTIETTAAPAKSDNEFGVDLSHLTPSARERTLAEMREGAARVKRKP